VFHVERGLGAGVRGMRRMRTLLVLVALSAPVAARASADPPPGTGPQAGPSRPPPGGVPAMPRPTTGDAWAEVLRTDAERRARLVAHLARRREAVEGVELLVAAGTRTPVQSRWGHALLRFVDGGDPLDDVVIAFVAMPERPRVSVWRGLTGGYPLEMDAGSLAWALGAYVRDQMRPVRRWVLPTTAPERAALVDAAVRWAAEPALRGRYTFFGNNCATALGRFLRDAGLIAEGRGWARRVPTRLPAAWTLARPARPVADVPALGRAMQRAADTLGVSLADVRAGRWRPAAEATGVQGGWDALGTLSVPDRLVLLWTVDLAPPDAREALLAGLPPPEARPSLEEVFGVVPVMEYGP
jgi:hypothetical protein